MTLDTLGRRKDRLAPVSTGRRVYPTARDLLWFEKLHRHGPLPSSYLAAYAPGTAENTIVKRLTHLSSEDNTPHGGRYLTRPAQQFATLDARCQQLVYDVSPRAVTALREAGRYRGTAPRTSGRCWKHDHMVACVCASIELATLREPDRYGYIFHDEVVARLGRAFFHVDGIKVTPDRWGGIRYLTRGGVILFALEADCATEPHHSRAKRKTLARNVSRYEAWITQGQYKKDLGTSGGIVVLNVTVNEQRMRNMIAAAEGVLAGGKAPYLLYARVPGFGPVYKPPRPLFQLFTRAYARPGLSDLCLRM